MLIQKTWVTIATQHFGRTVQFYCELFGQDPELYTPDRYAEFSLPGLRLGIYPVKTALPASPANASLSLCLAVTDLEVAIGHLTTLGYPPAEPIRQASHGREIDAYDPEGNRLILYQPLSSQVHYQQFSV